MEYQDYPHTLYKDGRIGDDAIIVADPGEEAAAVAQGYARAGTPPAKPARKPRA